MVELIYCAASSARFASIAREQGLSYGAQLPGKPSYAPIFIDQNWKNPNRTAYMEALKEYKPRMATVLDWEREEQLPEVLSWAEEASQHVTETIIIIPKVMSGIPKLPRTINNKQVRLGYSVPTSYGGTCLPIWEFCGWPVHLLGGSPGNQLKLRDYMDVRSVDGNYGVLIGAYGKYWTRNGEIKWQIRVEDGIYKAFRLSCANTLAAWNNCRATIRYANEADIDAIKRIASQHSKELGFVNKAALRDSISNYTLFVAEYMGVVVGFVNSYHRKDGWSTIYEIAVEKKFKGQGIGKALLDAVPRPVRLKCTIDNNANEFYKAQNLCLVRTEQGRKRQLNVWERPE